MKSATFLSLDIGATSGRAVLCDLKAGKLSLREIHRFQVAHHVLAGTMQWDFTGLWASVLESLRACAAAGCKRPDGIALDTWGCDFGLLGRDGKLLYSPVCYRDGRTDGIEKRIARVCSPYDLYRASGLPVLRVNTLSQLVGMTAAGGLPTLKAAGGLLFMADLLRYFLTGKAHCELTVAGTSQLLDVRKGDWSAATLRKFKLPPAMLPKLIPPGTVVGPLLPEICQLTGLEPCPVIAAASHDSADAAAAVPFADDESCFVSCGTWAVLGVTLPPGRPIVTRAAYEGNYLNETAVGSIMFVRNLVGFYPFEQLRQCWHRQGKDVPYASLLRQAGRQRPFAAYVDVNDRRFFAIEDGEASLRSYLRDSGQGDGQAPAAMVRMVLEGLAWSFRRTIEDLRQVTGRRIRRLCILGGAVRNPLLCQMAADATGCEVTAGPIEATTTGNALVQAMALGIVKGPEEIREITRRSADLQVYAPTRPGEWDRACRDYLKATDRPR